MSDITFDQDPAAEFEARELGSVSNFMAARKIATATWVMRWYTLLLSFQYMFFCSAFEMSHYFQRAMLANAVICAMRLHQRVPKFRFSRRHFVLLLEEDSSHYLIYSVIFLICHPVTIALMPVSTFALIHACNFTRQMLDVYGSNSYAYVRKVINHVARHQGFLFRFIAFNEALTFPTTLVMLFVGKANVLGPFLYYKFMHYRYLSKRNPYSRIMFYELRMALEQMTRNPNCPIFVNGVVSFMTGLCNRLAPNLPSPSKRE